GGNTSVKIVEKNLFGEDETVLYVKGSGWDLDSIEAEGFAPVRLEPVRRLATLEHLTDLQMADALRMNTLRGSAPAPSVEAILHAVLPYTYVDHTHADAVISITNSPDGERRIREIYGDDVVVVPYVMPGFRLARQVALQFPQEAHEGTIGLILMQHGVFSFGDTARDSYERMIALVDRAEQYLKRQGAWEIVVDEVTDAPGRIGVTLAELRQRVSRVAGAPVILMQHDDPLSRAFARRPDVASLSQRGPATPDHIIRTKQKPLVGRDVDAFAEDYRAYFEAHKDMVAGPLTMLDPAPRVILDPELGMVTVGRTARDARIGADLYAHTIEIILRAEALGGWQALPPRDLFEMEYWDLEQAKLRRQGRPPSLTGEIALVTGAASGIGKACVESLLARGAAVAGL